MFPSDTDFEPWTWRIQLLLGRFTPMGVLGEASPASPATFTTLYVMPTTSFFWTEYPLTTLLDV